MSKKWMCLILLVSLLLFISLESANSADEGDSFPTPPVDPPPPPQYLPPPPYYYQFDDDQNYDPPYVYRPLNPPPSRPPPVYPPPSLAPPVFPLADTDYYMAIPVNETGQERAWCYRDCGMTLTCPAECPLRVPSNTSMQGCFIDCSNCEATCKWRMPNCDNYGPLCYNDNPHPPPSDSPPTPPVDPPPSPQSDPPPTTPPVDPPPSNSPPTPPSDDQFNGGEDNDPGPFAVPNHQPVYPPPSLAPPVYPLADTDYYMAIPVNETGQERAWCFRDCGMTLTCPADCPFRVPGNSSMKGCFIDCSKCEATCKWRDPNCDNYGPLCYNDNPYQLPSPNEPPPTDSPPTPPVDSPPSPVDPPPSEPPPTPPVDPPPTPNDPPPSDPPPTPNQPVYPPPSLAPPVYPLAETDYYMAIPVNETGQERAWCYRDCGMTLTCPAECPLRVPDDSSIKGCFIDCSNCEATCKWRNPSCDNYGPSCYDDVQPPPVSPSSEPPPALNPPSHSPPTSDFSDYYMLSSVERTGQEQAFCSAKGGCQNKTLTCPAECPYRKPSNRTMKECIIDCSIKCEATCKSRKPLCDNLGSLCYDPRFVGGDGNMFYFHGFKGGNFAIVTDDNFQINAHFIGHRPKGKKRDLTWVQALSIMFDTHTLIIAAKKVSKWDDKVEALLVKWDNQLINIPTDEESEWRINIDKRVVVIERTDDFNTIRATVFGLVQVDTKVVPIGEQENQVHHYQIPADDAYAHLETQFKFFELSDTVEGVLGKTYQPGYESKVKMGDAMPVMGGEDKYQTPSLTSPLCKLCKFRRNKLSKNSIAMVTAI
ncbi:OLC1v1003968C1 [Oldenlandia corymbosa var. corymbosa]|uniref:OLC1v1003968C1 n=1 Tax=Oldenlandia corymbosa var. corymbosa TaxID=529605 RepID=A0AAV1DBU8_OLDCO|nr:OLC1v1003968C1 [Oldenlandia corymbosa var. corymbosa]